MMMASSVKHFGWYGNCSGSSVCVCMCGGGGGQVLKPLKLLHDDGCECNGPVVIEAGHCRLLWHRDDGGRLETCRDDGVVHEFIKYVSEDISQLVCTSSEHFAQNVVWSRSFWSSSRYLWRNTVSDHWEEG